MPAQPLPDPTRVAARPGHSPLALRTRRPTALAAAVLAALLPLSTSIHAAEPPSASAPAVTVSLDGGLQLLMERDPFWGLADRFSPGSDYPRSLHWLEVFVKPSVTARQALPGGLTAYGGASLLASGTIGDDVFLQGDKRSVGIEDAYVGLRGQVAGWTWDLSGGAQPYQLGHGFLLANGAGNGFERGAAVSAPRRAWGMTAIARASQGPFTAEAFHLNANELPSSDTGTRLWGVHGRWAPAEGSSIGLAHFRVTDSTAPYPKAPVSIIEGGRDGLQTTDLIWSYEPKAGPLAGFGFRGEAAWQRNSRIDLQASGFGFEAGWRFATLPFMPRLSWSMRRFSGDDPATPGTLERFDPLFYDGAPQTWSSGGNGSFAFYNSNLVVHRLRAELILSQRDFVNLNWWRVDAAQANSPVQYGQAARLSIVNGGIGLVSGFPQRALTQEVYGEYTRVLSPHLFLTMGLGGAMPRAGLEAVVPGARSWWGALVNLTAKY